MVYMFGPVYFPLDPGDCMCHTMDDAAYNIQNLTDFNCYTTDEECTTINCDISDSVAQSVSMSVKPCDDPPSVQVNVLANGHTHIIVANDNTTTSLSEIDAELRINLWHFDYSMDVQVSKHRMYIPYILE